MARTIGCTSCPPRFARSELIHKPLTPEVLLRRVRDALR